MEDYIILQSYDNDEREIFFFDHALTDGEIERIEKAIQKIKDELPDEYTIEDIEEAIDNTISYRGSLTCSYMDDHKIIYY